jgi:hypothetical protein
VHWIEANLKRLGRKTWQRHIHPPSSLRPAGVAVLQRATVGKYRATAVVPSPASRGPAGPEIPRQDA